MGNDTALDVRARQMENLACKGRYPSGSFLPVPSRGFLAISDMPSPPHVSLCPCKSYTYFIDFYAAICLLAEERERFEATPSQLRPIRG